ncbi:hypothetical protein IE53DRAFT_195809 [Violaceomyces palustris]|uniref:Uncharacterized protein n=2 Tax=Violaceomyces palustris TaxID=1673888 RepID=A0ACD0NPU1_9BASI|nr:hypothetical protein IE53DRAFT_226037 [Violaceomyces palustris]PWN48460.1 hypothetical protein IE53DRAFT_195809 [Violaceomyces palustris]
MLGFLVYLHLLSFSRTDDALPVIGFFFLSLFFLIDFELLRKNRAVGRPNVDKCGSSKFFVCGIFRISPQSRSTSVVQSSPIQRKGGRGGGRRKVEGLKIGSQRSSRFFPDGVDQSLHWKTVIPFQRDAWHWPAFFFCYSALQFGYWQGKGKEGGTGPCLNGSEVVPRSWVCVRFENVVINTERAV